MWPGADRSGCGPCSPRKMQDSSTPPAASPGRQAAYRAAAALENLAGSDEATAQALVSAGVVPSMVSLLLGTQANTVSRKSAKKGRSTLLRLVLLDRARQDSPAAPSAEPSAHAAAPEGRDAATPTATPSLPAEPLLAASTPTRTTRCPPPASPAA